MEKVRLEKRARIAKSDLAPLKSHFFAPGRKNTVSRAARDFFSRFGSHLRKEIERGFLPQIDKDEHAQRATTLKRSGHWHNTLPDEREGEGHMGYARPPADLDDAG